MKNAFVNQPCVVTRKSWFCHGSRQFSKWNFVKVTVWEIKLWKFRTEFWSRNLPFQLPLHGARDSQCELFKMSKLWQSVILLAIKEQKIKSCEAKKKEFSSVRLIMNRWLEKKAFKKRWKGKKKLMNWLQQSIFRLNNWDKMCRSFEKTSSSFAAWRLLRLMTYFKEKPLGHPGPNAASRWMVCNILSQFSNS